MKYIYMILLVLLMPCARAGAGDAADYAQASVPEVNYRSDFVDYQSFSEQPLLNWSGEKNLHPEPARDAATADDPPKESAAPYAHGQHE